MLVSEDYPWGKMLREYALYCGVGCINVTVFFGIYWILYQNALPSSASCSVEVGSAWAVAYFISSSGYKFYFAVLVSFTGAGNYSIYLNDTYGDGGTSVSADYSYVSGSAPPTTPISGTYSARSGDILSLIHN